MKIKRSLLALLFMPSVVWAQGEQFHEFTISDTTYVLMPSSLRQENKQLVALWNVSTQQHAWRWKVIVNGCDKPYGVIYTKMEGGERTDEWSVEGDRAYDHLAFHTCVSYLLRNKK